MKKTCFILGMAAHLCHYPTACRFTSDIGATLHDAQAFIDNLYMGLCNLKAQGNVYAYVDFEDTLAALSSKEKHIGKCLSFTRKVDYVPNWNRHEASCCWLTMLETAEGEVVERQRKLCKAIAPVVKDSDLDGLYSFHLWGAFWSELDCSALVEFED